MSSRDSFDDVLASPLRARSLLTVRAAISSALSSDEPRSRSESLMCSYCRARFVPFLVPRGGIAYLLRSPVTLVAYPGITRPQTLRFPYNESGEQWSGNRAKGDSVYISGGVLALIVVILLLVWIF
jgi:hypothetical protein